MYLVNNIDQIPYIFDEFKKLKFLIRKDSYKESIKMIAL
jgi:hypothetical protein